MRVKDLALGPTVHQMHSCNLNPDPSDSRTYSFFYFFRLETKGATGIPSIGRPVLEPPGRVLGYCS